MITVGITGAEGLIGFHLRAFFHGIPGVTVKIATRQTFFDQATLNGFARDCDAIVHLAGVNRGSNSEIREVNHALTRALVQSIETAEKPLHLLFSSSTHIDRDTVYGASKREAADALRNWSERTESVFTNLVL